MTTDASRVIGDLQRRAAGLSPPIEESGGLGAGSATRRYREGMITLPQLRAELEILGYPPARAERYVAAALLDEEYDRIMDLISIYSEAYREQAIDEPTLRELLGEMGIVPQRIEVIVLRENVRRAPTLGPVAAAGELAYYKTEAGRQRLASLKYASRQGLLTTTEFRRRALELGIPVDLADALADYEELREMAT